MKINKEDIIADVLKEYPETAEVFKKFGMHCLGCPTATGESIEEAAGVHGLEVSEMLEALNKEVE